MHYGPWRVCADPQFLQEAEARKIEIAPRYAEEVKELVLKTINAPTETIRKTEEALR